MLCGSPAVHNPHSPAIAAENRVWQTFGSRSGSNVFITSKVLGRESRADRFCRPTDEEETGCQPQDRVGPPQRDQGGASEERED